MCVSMGASSQTSSVGKQPDTGPIKSKYPTPTELIEQERKKLAKNKAKSLIGAGGDGPSFAPSASFGSSYGGTMGVSGNPNV